MNQEPFMEKCIDSDFENQSTESKIKLNGENKMTEKKTRNWEVIMISLCLLIHSHCDDTSAMES